MSTSVETDILRHNLSHCEEIEEAKATLGTSLEVLRLNSLYRNAMAMNVLQIGELANNLSLDFRKAHGEMPWDDMIKMRHIAVHRYGKFSLEVLRRTMINDIPELILFCQDRLGIEKMEEVAANSPRPRF
jgi:uncharacterized protein with HEPN domain